MYLWIKAFHIIAVICWFAGLFYLPRLFVYHSVAEDKIGNERFKLMESRLYYGIMWPSAIATTLLGLALLFYVWPLYRHALWLHLKFSCIILLWIYHLHCGHHRKRFAKDSNSHSQKYFRVYNEIPSLFLVIIVVLVVVKPFG